VGKCDIDANPMVPTQLEIRSIPSLLMFRSGQVVGQVVGAVPRARILDLVNKAL
jgi:thioredoxin-like negative regulator of GroEL